LKREFNKHLIIVGSARSGTSWLAETIAAQHRYRLLFEPEHEYNTEQGRLICDKFIQEKSTNPLIEQYLNKVFLNRIDNDWIAQCSNRKLKRHLWPFLPKKFIIKFVRANLAAHYMNQNFQIPLIHLLRNPYDVLHSQQRVRFPWLYDLAHFQQQEELLNLVKSRFDFDLKASLKCSEIEVLSIRWCLENVIPLQVLPPYSYNARIVRHEELRNDINLFRDLCNFFDLKPVQNLSQKYQVPSSKTHPKSEIKGTVSDSRKFSIKEYKEINRILEIFKCELYPREEY